MTENRQLSAIPTVTARAIAFVTVLLAGLAGAFIGFALVDLQCDGECALAKGFGLLGGAAASATGTAVVAVLALRAIGEWREINDRDRAGHAPQ